MGKILPLPWWLRVAIAPLLITVGLVGFLICELGIAGEHVKRDVAWLFRRCWWSVRRNPGPEEKFPR